MMFGGTARRNRLRVRGDMLAFSWRLVKHNRQVFWMPFVSLLLSVLVLLLVAVPVIVELVVAKNNPVVSVVTLLIFYLLMNFVHSVCTGAIIIFIDSGLKGRGKRIFSCFKQSLSCWKALLGWSLIAATVGVILHSLERSHKGIASFIIDVVIGAAWSLMSFFVLPMIVLEQKGPIQAMKDSLQMIKGTWGGVLISFGLISLLFFLLYAAGAGIVALLLTHAHISGVMLAVCLLFVGIYWIVIGMIQVVLWTTCRTILYRYNQSGEMPKFCPQGLTPFEDNNSTMGGPSAV